MTDALIRQAEHAAAVQAFHREIEVAVQKLAAESERITSEKFDWSWWHDGLPELLNDCLLDANQKLDMAAADEAEHEYATNTAADVRAYHGSVL